MLIFLNMCSFLDYRIAHSILSTYDTNAKGLIICLKSCHNLNKLISFDEIITDSVFHFDRKTMEHVCFIVTGRITISSVSVN